MNKLYKIDDELNIKLVRSLNSQKKKKKNISERFLSSLIKPILRYKLTSNKFSVVNYFNIGYYILTPIIIGVFSGLIIKQLFRQSDVLILIFIFIGMIASFYNIWKIYKDSI